MQKIDGIAGAWTRDIEAKADDRGELRELFRQDWGGVETPRQWNLVTSKANTLRGVHVHREHDDYLIVLQGEMHLGLRDIRPDSPTCGTSAMVVLNVSPHKAAFVPRGVIHGFCFTTPTTYVYGLTACWTPADDLGCRWNDPALEFKWPVANPLLSARDRQAIGLAALQAEMLGGKVP